MPLPTRAPGAMGTQLGAPRVQTSVPPVGGGTPGLPPGVSPRNGMNLPPGVSPRNGLGGDAFTPGPGGGGEVTGPGGFHAYGDPHTMGAPTPTQMSGTPPWMPTPTRQVPMHGGGLNTKGTFHDPLADGHGGFMADSGGMEGANTLGGGLNAVGGYGEGAGSLGGGLGAAAGNQIGDQAAQFDPYGGKESGSGPYRGPQGPFFGGAPGMLGGAKPLNTGPASGLNGAAAGRMQLADLIRRGGGSNL